MWGSWGVLTSSHLNIPLHFTPNLHAVSKFQKELQDWVVLTKVFEWDPDDASIFFSFQQDVRISLDLQHIYADQRKFSSISPSISKFPK